MKTMKSTLLLSVLLAASFTALTACRTAPPTPEQQAQAATNLANVCKAIKAIVQTGLTADLLVNPQHRPMVVSSKRVLDDAITLGQLSGAQLAGIVAGLPVKQETILFVTGTLLIYDGVSGFWYTGDTQKVLLAIGQAVSDGAAGALAYSTKGGRAGAPSPAAAAPPPAPVSSGPGCNVRPLR